VGNVCLHREDLIRPERKPFHVRLQTQVLKPERRSCISTSYAGQGWRDSRSTIRSLLVAEAAGPERGVPGDLDL
jgi:hypothetical protein